MPPLTLTLSCSAAMSKWLNDGEVLVGQGSGEAVSVSPRLRSLPPGSPMPSRVRSPLASPGAREGVSGSPQAETMGKAKELFVLCDKEGKGFITKRDMQVRQKKKVVRFKKCYWKSLEMSNFLWSEATRGVAAVPWAAGGGVWESGPAEQWVSHSGWVQHRTW